MRRNLKALHIVFGKDTQTVKGWLCSLLMGWGRSRVEVKAPDIGRVVRLEIEVEQDYIRRSCVCIE